MNLTKDLMNLCMWASRGVQPFGAQRVHLGARSFVANDRVNADFVRRSLSNSLKKASLSIIITTN